MKAIYALIIIGTVSVMVIFSMVQISTYQAIVEQNNGQIVEVIK